MLSPQTDDTRALPVPPTRTLLTLLALGVAFDLAFHGQEPGISIPLFTVSLAGTMFLQRWASPRAADDLLLGVAVVLSIFPALLASEGMIALDILAIMALFALAAARDDGGVASATVVTLLRRAGHVIKASFRAPVVAIAPLARLAGALPGRRWRPVVRTIAIAAPIVAVFAALLASADAVFGDLLLPSLPTIDLSGAATHAGLIALGVAAAATLWLAAQRRVPADVFEEPSLLPRLRPSEAMTVLVALDLLFALFVAVQFAVLFGGHERVEVTPGLTYAEYARSGFFQLIAVAGLTVGVILAAWDMGDWSDRRNEQRFRVLVTVMVGSCAVILVSALMRLSLYEQTFGFTLNRLAGYLAIGFIGFVLVALTVAIWLKARERVVAVLLAGALATLLAANIINPERFVATRNVARFQATGKVDLVYLGTLGPDAAPVIAPLLARRRADEGDVFRSLLCEQLERLAQEPGWRSANLARASARDALGRAGLDPVACGFSLGGPHPAAVRG